MNTAVIVYDNQCLLCSKSVLLVLKHDRNFHFKFTHFESRFSKKYALSNNTVAVILPNHEVLTKHVAVRYIIENIDTLHWLRFLFIVSPLILQKMMYNIVAANRKRVFKKTKCSVRKSNAERFIS